MLEKRRGNVVVGIMAFIGVCVAIAAIVFALRGAKDATGGKPAAVPVFLLLFCLLAVSEILGRALFFGTIVRM